MALQIVIYRMIKKRGNAMDEVQNVKKYYDDNPLGEWNRLEGFHYEFEITKYMLNKYLKKGSILDIGGGTGRYSIYLAQLGYDVTLVDLSDENVKFAKEKAKELGAIAYITKPFDIVSLCQMIEKIVDDASLLKRIG